VFNLIFAVAAFWVMLMIGVSETRPVLGPVDGLAAESGLRQDDLIVEIDGNRVDTWTHAVLELMPAALDRRAVDVVVEDRNGVRRSTALVLDRLGPEFSEERLLQSLGMRPWRIDLPPVIGEVSPGLAAERAGIEPGDRVLSVAGVPVDGWLALVEQIAAAAAVNAPLSIEIERAGQRLQFELVPDPVDGRPVLGVRPPPLGPEAQTAFDRTFIVLRLDPLAALGGAVSETWRLTAATFGILGRMVTGSASLSNLSGPVTIAQMANQSASLGLSRFLFFLGLISLSLAIINLLPIPVLDGGHLLYLLVEWIKGSPVSEQGQAVGQGIGLLMILALMSLAVFNDILRLVQ
jgi:regulator of sigma E protease